MPLYLVHQRIDGTPLGIFSETDHFYFSNYAYDEPYGVGVNAQRLPTTSWARWADAQASKWPGPHGMWDSVELPETSLEEALLRVRRELVSSDDLDS